MVDQKSFTAAAKVLGLKKETVSHKVTALEDAIGQKLIDKTGNRISLTEAGEKYYEYAKEITKMAFAANEKISEKINNPHGTLRVTTTPNIGWLLFDDLFANFLTTYPKIKLEMNLSNEYVDIIKKNYDVAIRLTTTPFEDSSLIARNLVDVEVGLYASKEYLQTSPAIKSIEDLKQHQAIQTTRREFSIFENGEKHRLEFKRKVFINSIDACLRATKENFGIALFPTSAFTAKLESMNLVRVLPECKMEPSTLYVVYSGNDLRPPKLEVFLAFINEWKKSLI